MSFFWPAIKPVRNSTIAKAERRNAAYDPSGTSRAEKRAIKNAVLAALRDKGYSYSPEIVAVCASEGVHVKAKQVGGQMVAIVPNLIAIRRRLGKSYSLPVPFDEWIEIPEVSDWINKENIIDTIEGEITEWTRVSTLCERLGLIRETVESALARLVRSGLAVRKKVDRKAYYKHSGIRNDI